MNSIILLKSKSNGVEPDRIMEVWSKGAKGGSEEQQRGVAIAAVDGSQPKCTMPVETSSARASSSSEPAEANDGYSITCLR